MKLRNKKLINRFWYVAAAVVHLHATRSTVLLCAIVFGKRVNCWMCLYTTLFIATNLEISDRKKFAILVASAKLCLVLRPAWYIRGVIKIKNHSSQVGPKSSTLFWPPAEYNGHPNCFPQQQFDSPHHYGRRKAYCTTLLTQRSSQTVISMSHLKQSKFLVALSI